MNIQKYDYCVVGGGHNGLVAATILQRTGARVCLVEAKHEVGGACRASPHFGLRVSWGANFLFMLSKEVISATGLSLDRLKLKRATAEFHPIFGAELSNARSAEGLTHVLQPLHGDHSELLHFERERELAATVFKEHLFKRNALRSEFRRDLEQLGLSSGTLFATGSITELLDHFFHGSTHQQALLATGKVLSMYPPSRSGTAISFLYLALANTDDFGSWSVPLEGMSAVTTQMEEIYRQAGGTTYLRTAAEVLQWNGKRISGLRTFTGLEISARAFVLMVSPTEALQILGDRVAESERQPLEEAWKSSVHDGGCSKLSIFAAKPLVFRGVDQSVLKGTMLVRCLSLEEWERAHCDASESGHSQRPYVEIFSPTEFFELDRGSPFAYSVYLMYSSYTRLLSMTDCERQKAKLQLVDALLGMVQNPEDVVSWDAKDPIDLQSEFGLVRGNVDHGIFEFNNSLDGRRSIRTDSCAENLVISGSGFMVGGLVSGLPGLLAAREALALVNVQ